MVEQVLIIIGASILGFLGTLHLIFTFFSNKFTAFDPEVTKAMKGTSPRITKDTTMWKAWIGFNASHSLGVMLIAAFYIPLAGMHMEIILSTKWFLYLLVITSGAYLWLASRYWFKIPFLGALISTLCFLTAAILIHAK